MDLSKVDDLVKQKLTSDMLEEYNEIEAISKEFDRKNEGYRHSSYLVYIATKCITTEGDVVPF